MIYRIRAAIFLLTTMGLIIFMPSQNAAGLPTIGGANQSATLQASGTIAVVDERIAALWKAVPSRPGEETTVRRDCTASYLGNNFWLTAHHCVSSDMNMRGYLEQSDKETAGIANIYILSPRDDVALIKTNDGISAEKFQLPHSSLEVGKRATLLGYAISHDYASAATTTITNHLADFQFNRTIYTQLFEGKSTTPSRSCGGDSGGPIFIDNTVYAVHTGGSFNPDCTDGQDKLMWHTDVFPRTQWIKNTMDKESGITATEAARAKEGLALKLKDHKKDGEELTANPHEVEKNPTEIPKNTMSHSLSSR